MLQDFVDSGLRRQAVEIEYANRAAAGSRAGAADGHLRDVQGSEESLHLNLSMGVVLVGTLKEVGRKFGKLLDVHVLQKMME